VIDVTDRLRIPEEELGIRASTSSGPGGQNVNRVRTRITVRFNVRTSPSLNESDRVRLLEALGSRLDAEGNLQVRSQKHRTQHQNREAAIDRLRILLAEALRPPTPRRPTSKPRGADERRLESKRQRSRIKAIRRRPGPSDD
jgi:ribosome-associated protein